MKSPLFLLLILIFNSQFLSGQCKLDSLDSYQIDPSGKSLYGARFLINYSFNGNQYIEERMIRDTISKKLSASSRIIQTLDNKGRIVSTVDQYFSKGAYVNSSRTDYTYFPDGKTESEIAYGLDRLKQFVIDKKTTYQYDSLSNYKFIHHFFYNKNLGKYETYYDQEFKYYFDARGNIIKKFDVDLWPTYFTNKRHLYTYNANDQLQTEIIQSNTSTVKFDETSFQNRERNEYLYNQTGKIISARYYAVPVNDTIDQLYRQVDYTYDVQDRILHILEDEGRICRTDYVYSNDGYTERYTCGEILEKKYYNCIISELNRIQTKQITISPNPASDVIYLNQSSEEPADFEYQIADFYGRIISSSKLKGSNSINISGLEIGHYVLLIKKNDQTSVFRFSKAY
ncbi:MAG: T9SS type A sorting domain-containing protein [Saprospiraceae bacterium]|nr:T9SS type A sorting domain-containing protein [Saprospiraceae bacterium]HMW39780.1 T9SS type A sorting domain-containing protein [Saprospiraceae bacterium]HMX89394.1 T9SS type A sorting domain-containing protein [Saprospiraceae bacterium]HMZ39958.1 T9SS type A sorting domain-containing protein [Saprospiraceae bacterium]HNA65404.1 T9SS type A sorting domain-containing protein [Saprospiraceae bacterium]